MRSPFDCALVEFLGQRLPWNWATSPTMPSLLPTLCDPLWPQPPCQHSHGASTAIHAATLPCPVHSCTNTGLAGGSPRAAGRRQSSCLLLLAWLPKYFHRTSNLNPCQPDSELHKTQEHNKPQAPSILSGGDGYWGLNARLGVSVTISIGFPGSSKRRSCSARPERLTSYCSLGAARPV